MHLDCLKVPGVDVSTGSLGHGLGIGLGLALGARLQNQKWHTYVVLGDGELNGGPIWEAAQAAAHFKITNMTTIIDRNGLCIDGRRNGDGPGTPAGQMGGLRLARWWRSTATTLRPDCEAIEQSHAEKEQPSSSSPRRSRARASIHGKSEGWHYRGFG
jgi:transketolase